VLLGAGNQVHCSEGHNGFSIFRVKLATWYACMPDLGIARNRDVLAGSPRTIKNPPSRAARRFFGFFRTSPAFGREAI
jgi:hypothetical protein